MASLVLALMCLVWTLAAGIAYRRKHYVLGLFLTVVGLYELPGMAIASGSDQLGFLIAKTIQQMYRTGTSDNQIFKHILALATFLLAMLTVYYLTWAKIGSPVQRLAPPRQAKAYWPHMLLLLAFGLIAVYTGAGVARQADYRSGLDFGTEVTGLKTVIFFGRILLVVSVPLLIRYYEVRSWPMLILLLVGLSPLVIELVIAGRRQVFAPSVCFLLLYLLYHPSIKHKWLAASVIVTAFVGIAAVLFSFRTETIREDYGLVGTAAYYRPLFGEFVAVSAISLAAETEIGSHELSYGAHLFKAFLDSVIPFIRIGDFLKDSLNIFDWTFDLLRIAPFGALSMYADAYLSVGLLAGPLLGAFMGCLAAWMHRGCKHATAAGSISLLSPRYMWVMCLTATLLMEYRSGLLDSIYVVTKLAFMFWVPILFMTFLKAGNTSRFQPISDSSIFPRKL